MLEFNDIHLRAQDGQRVVRWTARRKAAVVNAHRRRDSRVEVVLMANAIDHLTLNDWDILQRREGIRALRALYRPPPPSAEEQATA